MGDKPGSTDAISLVVAISGDSDLHPDDFPWYQAEIEKILAEYRSRYLSTPILVISGLAEGAQQIGVRAARSLGIDYVAVLPMPEEFYRDEFSTEAFLDFEEMKAGARRVIQLPLPARVSNDEPRFNAGAREAQYAELNRFLALNSQVLIAIWRHDGARDNDRTRNLVRIKLNQLTPAETRGGRPISGSGGPVYIIPVRRTSAEGLPAPSVSPEPEYPSRARPGTFQDSYRLLDQFNRDARTANGDFASEVKNSRKDLLGGREGYGMLPAMEWVADIYARADALANRCARVSFQLWLAIFLLIGISGLALAIEHTRGASLFMLAVYYSGLAAAFCLVVWERNHGLRSRHEDYRALAEALRVQYFWMGAGVRDLVSDQYLQRQSSELIWLRDAVSECALYEGVLTLAPEAVPDSFAGARFAAVWVNSQKDYFTRRVRQLSQADSRYRILARAALIVGLATPAAGLLLKHYDMDPYEAGARVTAAIAMWLAALIWRYLDRQGFAQEAKQYGRMRKLFEYAQEDLEAFEREGSFDASVKTIRELGCMAVEENYDWLLAHRERELSDEMAAG